jgi:2-polyprenyl-6-hydroxyphenyl methylase/3-demethylubiquinone-9 3-methyltransferase
MEFSASEFRERQKKVWSSGDWPDVAKSIQPVADDLVAEAEISDGVELLDLGTGSGNLAIPAAQAGAKATGSDITTELFDAARARAAEAGVEVDWVEADAADLPFEDDSYDRVMTVFGAIFAPVHQQAADEMARVCRPGGMIGICGWTPESVNGQMLGTIGKSMPPPPEGVQSPILWGDEDHVRELFKDKDIELDFERKMADLNHEGRFASNEEWMDYAEENLGPVIMAKAALSEGGEWDGLRSKLLEVFAEGETGDGKLESEYLRTIARPK